MRPTLACGHTEYDRGHCGIVGCENDYFTCLNCCPSTQLRPGVQRASVSRAMRRGAREIAQRFAEFDGDAP